MLSTAKSANVGFRPAVQLFATPETLLMQKIPFINSCQQCAHKYYGLVWLCLALVMVALWNRADHYIFIMSFIPLLSVFFFPRLISAVADWMSAILAHMMWP